MLSGAFFYLQGFFYYLFYKAPALLSQAPDIPGACRLRSSPVVHQTSLSKENPGQSHQVEHHFQPSASLRKALAVAGFATFLRAQ